VAENFSKLENIIQKDDYYCLIARVYNLPSKIFSISSHAHLLKESLKIGYSCMVDHITGLADINALIMWARIHLLSESNILTNRIDIENYFKEMRRINPSSINYHLDGKGDIAYLIINNWI
jgi:hypothetical protein